MSIMLAPFKALIKERSGLSFEDAGEQKLAAVLGERMGRQGAAAYHARLCGDAAEFQELVNLLTVNETYFFREPEQIRLLVERIAPRLLAARGAAAAPIRILSAGCASGEEPYSLAMALHERYGESVGRLFAFVGGDIDSTVLAKARGGRYAEFSFRGVPAALRERYFTRDRRAYVIRDEVRAAVQFYELNLLAQSFPPELRGFDVVFFRNVSIYFDTPTRKLIQQNLAGMMNDDGILMTGSAETLANDLGVLPLVHEDGLFYFVKGHPPPAVAAPASLLPHQGCRAPSLLPLQGGGREGDGVGAAMPNDIPAPTPPQPLPSPPLEGEGAAAPLPDVQTLRELVRDKRYDAALPHLERLLAAQPQDGAALLLLAYIRLNRKDLTAAEAAAQQVLAAEPWSIDALLLRGLAAKWRGDAAAAVRCFKQAVYAQHHCWPAHYYLADLYRNGGETELARRAYRAALQLLAGGGEPDSGLRVIPLELPAAEIRFLCEHQLVKLGGRMPAASTR